MNMIKKIILAVSILAVVGITVVVATDLVKPAPPKPVPCKNDEFQIPLTLQSGEKGTVYITDDLCNLLQPAATKKRLQFTVLADGAVDNSISGSHMYVWARDSAVTVENQLGRIAQQYTKRVDLCSVIKSQYLSSAKLYSYSLGISEKFINKVPKNSCTFFGEYDDYTFEVYYQANNVLYALRTEGYLEPFDLASIKFVPQ